MKPYYILCLDGGGSWDIIQAMALKEIYGDVCGHKILRNFDLIVANSGGSLIAAGLVEGLKPSEIVALIKDERKRKRIFSKLTFFERPFIDDLVKLLGIGGPKYSAERKLIGLNEALPKTNELYMQDAPAFIGKKSTHLVICGFDYERERAVFFRSNPDSMAQSWKIEQRYNPKIPNGFTSVLLHQAIHASSNAPVNYFNKPATFKIKGDNNLSYFWDGAIGGFNNPILVALIEAKCNGIQDNDIHILSIGTGNTFLPIISSNSGIGLQFEWLAAPYVEPSFRNDLPKMAKSILSDPPDSDTFITYTMMFPHLPKSDDRFVRLNPLIQPVLRNSDNNIQWTIPEGLTPEDFQRLIKLDMDAVEQADVELIDVFCEQWIKGNISNQPIRAGGNLECVLGFPNFDAGKKAWQSVMMPLDNGDC